MVTNRLSSLVVDALALIHPQIRISDRVCLNHPVSRELDRVWKLPITNTYRISRMREEKKMSELDIGRDVNECAADDLAVLHPPLDLAALICRQKRRFVMQSVIRRAARHPDVAGPHHNSEGANTVTGSKTHDWVNVGVNTIWPAADSTVDVMAQLSIIVFPVAAEHKMAKS